MRCGVECVVMAGDGANARRTLQVLGTGAALPGPALTIDEILSRPGARIPANAAALARRLARRLGIRTRHLSRSLVAPIEAVRDEDSAPRLAARALQSALIQARQTSGSIDFLIGHTATPHTLLPSNTAWTADELGFSGPHVELRQACTGFAAAVLLAAGLPETGFRRVAVVGSETGSVYFDPRRLAEDPGQLVNLVQMGDGAGAIVLAAHTDALASRIEHPFYGSRGVGRAPALLLAQGGSGSPSAPAGGVPTFEHDHEAGTAHGIDLLRASLAAARAAGGDPAGIDWFLPHQANGRMPEICAEHLNLPLHRVVCEAHTVGNLGSAAMWLALDRLRRSGRLGSGDRVLVLGAEATKYLYGGFVYVHGCT
jgi:3-oxoacyl-[acyl-carrier-protein] synthase-3